MMRRVLPLFLILMILAGCGGQPPAVQEVSPSPEATATPEVTPDVSPSPEPEPEPEPIVATLTVAGDVMSHMSVVNAGYDQESGEYDFSAIMEAAAPWVESADLAVANLETTFSGGPNYSGFPAFNAPDALGYDLKEIGFDLLCTTNNHAIDRGYTGLCRTLDVLDEIGLAHVGTYRTQEERDANSGIVVADCGGISIAFLAYSYGTNAIPVPEGKEYCINLFNTDYLTNLSTPDTALLEADMAAARELGCDLIAVVMHWGVEYQAAPNRYQQQLAETMVDLGADLVLGGHPHVLQPYEFLTTEAGNSGFVCYSLGNFISNQDFYDANTTVLLNLELKKDLISGETTVERAGYVPFFMVNPGANYLKRPVILLDTYASMAAYESGESTSVSNEIYALLQNSLEVCHTVMGEVGDLRLEITDEPAADDPGAGTTTEAEE